MKISHNNQAWGGNRLVLAALLLISLFTAANTASAFECPPLQIKQRQYDNLLFDSGLLFRITGGAAAPSYLFGTIHISDPAAPGFPEPVAEALKSSRTFVMEVLMDLRTVMEVGMQMFYKDGRTLIDEVDAELADQAAGLLTRHGIPRAMALNMKPWAAFTTLSTPAGAQTVPLDLLLMQEAQALGLGLDGLETLDEQIQVFTGLSSDEQVNLLTQTVCYYDTAQADLQDLIRLYNERNLRGMLEVSTRYGSNPPEFQEEFLEALLWSRNDRMFSRMLPHLNQGAAFFAVGALHLPGSRGLLERLLGRGYKVERIY